jgi:uncharacterized protein YaaQ
MILLIVIVQAEDVGRLSEQLIRDGYRFTRVNASGGFLANGSSVLLVGMVEDRLPAVAALVGDTCHTRLRVANASAWTGMVGGYAAAGFVPTETTIGGAVVYAIPVERFLQFGGSPGLPAVDVAAGDETLARRGTKLVVAIVQKDDADAAATALMDAGHRLTRIDTAGGFLRRGSVTLLIGAAAFQLADVLAILQVGCRPRAERAPNQEGMPAHSATVFVLDTSQFLRF